MKKVKKIKRVVSFGINWKIMSMFNLELNSYGYVCNRYTHLAIGYINDHNIMVIEY